MTDKWDWVGKIETVTGKTFDLENPHADDIDIIDIATALSHICRYNGHLQEFYSVAEHSLRVTHWLRDKQQSRETMLTGLLHDAAEAYIGDMPRPFKRHPEYGKHVREADDQISKIIMNKYGGIYPLPDIVHEADRQTYLWEVDNIRKYAKINMSPRSARGFYIGTFKELTNGTPSTDS